MTNALVYIIIMTSANDDIVYTSLEGWQVGSGGHFLHGNVKG